MIEYITKEQALEAVRGKMWPGEIEAAIKAIPAADVVKVVRCEECKHRVVDEIILSLSSRPETAEVCGIGVSGCLPGFFCGHGKRKDGEEND